MLRTLLAAALICSAGVVFSHSFYPMECCHGQDCREIDASEIAYTKEGAYVVIASGEIFAHPGSTAPIRKARFSPDGRFHRCTPNGERGAVYTICLFVPRSPEF